MIKKLSALLLSLICVISLFGCSEVSVLSGESKIIRLYVGQEGSFENSGYSYQSDDETVLEINGNAYKALKSGSVSVKVTDKKANAVAVYMFVIFGNKPVELTTLSIQGLPENNSLQVGQSANLSYNKQPIDADAYDAIVWECSNPEFLSVDRNGKITANKMGSATLTLKAIGTNFSESVVINVLPRDTVFALNLNKAIGIVGETENLLKADILCDYPIQREVAWFTSDAETVAVNNGELTFLKAGKASVGINALINEVEYQAVCEITVLEDEGYTVIRTPEQLQEIGNVSANYMLGNDIDMAVACAEEGSLYNAGKGFMPLFESADHSFKGVFDGNGFAIKNIMINRPNDSFVALMRYISAEEGKSGVIKNLSVVGGSIKGANYTSVFYANCSGYGNVNSGLENCYAQLDLSSTGSVSGLVGNNKGIVKNCVSNVTFDALGKICLFALNHTTLNSVAFGVKNCVYIGESVECEMANVANGGFITDCYAITKDQVATFNFELGDGWNYVLGEIPTVKGV